MPGYPGYSYYPAAPQFQQHMQGCQPPPEIQHTRQETETVEIEKPIKQKAKRVHWSAVQTNALVSAWQENYDILNSKDANKGWAQIVKIVNLHGTVRSLDQIKRKFAKIQEKYIKCKDANSKKTGEGLHTCPYYEELDKLLHQKKKVKLPELTEVGAVGVSGDETIENEVFDEENVSEPSEDSFDNLTEPDNPPEPADNPVDPVADEPKKPTMEASGRKRKTQEDCLESSFEYYEDLKEEVRNKNRSKATSGKEKKKTFQEDLIEIQKQQMQMFKDSEKQFQTFQTTLFEKQIAADALDKEKERTFYLEFAKIMAGNQQGESSKSTDK